MGLEQNRSLQSISGRLIISQKQSPTMQTEFTGRAKRCYMCLSQSSAKTLCFHLVSCRIYKGRNKCMSTNMCWAGLSNFQATVQLPSRGHSPHGLHQSEPWAPGLCAACPPDPPCTVAVGMPSLVVMGALPSP